MAQKIDIITDELEQHVKIARQATSAITDAASLLSSIAVHTDWECPQRDSIIENTNRDRTDAMRLQTDAESFYHAVEAASQQFQAAEQDINKMISQVEGMLSEFLSLVPSADHALGWAQSAGSSSTPHTGGGYGHSFDHMGVGEYAKQALSQPHSIGQVVKEQYVPKIKKAIQDFGNTIDFKNLACSIGQGKSQ